MAADSPLLMGRPLPSSGAFSGVLEALAFFRDPEFARRRFERLGDVFETKLLGQQLVFIRGERAMTDLLGSNDATEGWWPESVRQLLGSRSLANRNGADHRARRRVVGQLFSAAALRRYSPEIVQLVDQLAAELLAAREPVRLVDRMRRFAFAVIASVVLGLEGGDVEALFADFEIWTRALFSVPIAIPGSPFAKALQARARLLDRLRSVLERAQHAPTGGLDLLSGGLDEVGLPLTDDDLVEQLLLLLFAGYETTASSLSCLMATLLQHPQSLAWLQEEIHTLAWPPSDSPATPRLDAVVQEVMRLNPPVGGFFRRTPGPWSWAECVCRRGALCRWRWHRLTASAVAEPLIWMPSVLNAISRAERGSRCCPLAVVSGCASARRSLSWKSGSWLWVFSSRWCLTWRLLRISALL
ncbi:hypothetical protein MNNICLKF_00510 [Synechococcus sp. CBW1107]|nr:hypothetical protein MNNICLKF_00510 [Synechococcus sp. CBW1107]